MSTYNNNIPDASGPVNACLHRATEHPYVRPSGNASAQDFFSDNYSSVLGKYTKFNRCRKDNCKIKCKDNNMVLPLNNFHSSFNNKSFVIRSDENLDCCSSNIIYLITCTVCKKQYVGESKRDFAMRMSEHVRQIKKRNNTQIVYSHFQKDEAHRSTPVEKRLRFQIIEKVKMYPNEDIESEDVKRRRLARELFWIARLRTAFPTGLNDMIQGCGLKGKASDPDFTEFNPFRFDRIEGRKRRKRKRYLKKKGSHKEEDFIAFFNKLNQLDPETSENIESIVVSQQRSFLKKFIATSHFIKLKQAVRYIIKRRFEYVLKDRPVKKVRDQQICKIDFIHKIIEDINFPAILRTKKLADLLPPGVDRKTDFRIIYKCVKPACSKVLNYNKTLRELKEMSFDEIENLDCGCENSDFKDENHGHIITGNLEIVENEELRQLLSYGTKFRETPILNIEKIKESVIKNIDTLIGSLARKHKIRKSSFERWRIELLKIVNNRLDEKRYNIQYRKPSLGNFHCKQELARLQDQFVITVVDKAAGNYAFTCKKLYLLVLAKELGLNREILGNETYYFTRQSEEQICLKLIEDMKKYRIKPDDSCKKLALLYHNPKFHKNPTKFRFIAGNVGTAVSALDDRISKILKMCKRHFTNLLKKNGDYKNVRYVFDIENSLELKKQFDSYGPNNKAETISINDFSTLYTLFEHDHIKLNMKWLFDKLQGNKKCDFIKVGFKEAFWTNKDGDNSFSVPEILEMINFLIDNSYIKAFGKVFRQIKGIIMGGRISGWISDLSLMVDEYKFMKKLEKENRQIELEKFKGFSRYRDDCTVINIDNFIEIAKDIYPPSLELTQENDDFSKADVLDMKATIVDWAIQTSVYCKTDDFPFNVISLPFLESNLSSRVCYLVFFGQILRFSRLCSKKEDFINRVERLGKILLERGYEFKRLRSEFCKVIDKYRTIFEKWDTPLDSYRWFNLIFNS